MQKIVRKEKSLKKYKKKTTGFTVASQLEHEILNIYL